MTLTATTSILSSRRNKSSEKWLHAKQTKLSTHPQNFPLAQPRRGRKLSRPAVTFTEQCKLPARPSRPIPLPQWHIRRTSSEVQLCEDTAVAEWRELCMFQRLVFGMEERRRKTGSLQPLHVESADSFGSKMTTNMKRTDGQTDLGDILKIASDIATTTLGDIESTKQDRPGADNHTSSARLANNNTSAEEDDNDEGIFIMDL